MKKIIFTIVLFALTITTVSGQRNWGDWRESNISGIYYRVAYDYYNEYSAKDGKPAHVWCMEINNRNEAQAGISWCIGDKGQSIDAIKDKRRNSSMKPNEVEKSCIHFTNTPPEGTVTIYIWNNENSENTNVSDEKESSKVSEEKESSNESNEGSSNNSKRSISESIVGTWVLSSIRNNYGVTPSYYFSSNGTGYQILPDTSGDSCPPYYYKNHLSYEVSDNGGIKFWFTKIDVYCGYQFNVRELYPTSYVIPSNQIFSGAIIDGEGNAYKKT